MKLVVVESPAKAKTIEKYLGSDYRVLASYGHVRDLPPRDGSVDPDAGFAMEWETYADKSRQLKAITDEAKKADALILATDPDREGEAISWHVQEVLRQKKALPANVQRVTFNAITNSAVTEAMKHPRGLDEDLIDAYRAHGDWAFLRGNDALWRSFNRPGPPGPERFGTDNRPPPPHQQPAVPVQLHRCPLRFTTAEHSLRVCLQLRRPKRPLPLEW